MKVTVGLVLIALLAFSEARVSLHPKGKPNTDNDNALATNENFGTALLNFILAYTKIMPCGFKPWNLPPLAPFTLDNWAFNFHSDFYSVTGDLTNLVITGLNDYRMIEYVYDPNSGKITYDVMYYDVQILAEYNASAWAMVAGYNATVEGYGPLNWEFKDIRAIGEVTVGPNNEGGTLISDFKMNFFVGDVIPGSWNYKWDIAFNNFANKWFREFILMWSQQAQGLVNNIYNKDLLPKENQSLQNISMTQIIAFFVEQTELMNAANCGASQSS